MFNLMSAWSRWVRCCLVALALVALGAGKAPSAWAALDPAQGPGGPILVVTSGTQNFGTYYAEILRTEGLNAFAVADVSTLSANTLAAHDVVLLSQMTLTSAQVTLLTNWVSAGGNLIAMAPDARLTALLGITPAGSTLTNGYLRVDGSSAAGSGITGQTMQFHGTAELYNLTGATALGLLYSGAATATPYPALTLHPVGSGLAAAFTYDLASSIVYTRQGNPAWARQERDGSSPIRSSDKFYGNAANDVQPDWVDLGKVAIPQADEQQRWLANLILGMNAARKPLPRFWYFPHGKKAVVIMTGDDHGNGGTGARFDQFRAASPAGCSVADWECVRGTSYIYANTPISNTRAAQYDAEGFEISSHISTGCANYTTASLETAYATQLVEWQTRFPSLPAPLTQRHHCVVWSDWTSGAEVQSGHGIRLDTTYYFWPPAWVNNVPGVFTGSAMPMRFARLDGSLVDVYQATTQMTDESGQTYPFTIDTLLDRALGTEGYFGAYTVNAHTDYPVLEESDTVVASALARGVPVVSARQMLTWLDARNGSSFDALAWNGSDLTFGITRAGAANGLQAMLPRRSGARLLESITRAGVGVAFSSRTVKGIEYAFFAAEPGTYVASYGADVGGPAVLSTSPSASATGVLTTARVSATFSTAMDAASLSALTFELRDAAGSLVSASVAYDAGTRTATLAPSAALAAAASYTATLRGGATDPRVKDATGIALAADVSWTFSTAAAVGSGCPCGAWSATTTPTLASASDPNPVELGVRFRTDVDGFVTGVRFYKGAGNTGTHIGSVWSTGGTRLATATFTGETATGWQQVNFATPLAVTANTVYVASYFAPNGRYAADLRYFASTGVDTPPVHLLRDGVSGANGLYAYGSSSRFPASTYLSTNYWVDVVFSTATVADTTPPAVTATSPVNGATGVANGTAPSATFSEALDAASVNTSTFELRNAAGALVASGASLAVAVTGIAGPTGGTPEKPVGEVWIGWKRRGRYPIARVFHFGGDREAVRRQTVAAALTGLMGIAD